MAISSIKKSFKVVGSRQLESFVKAVDGCRVERFRHAQRRTYC